MYRQCSCGHFSSVLVLLANMLLHPTEDGISLDKSLTAMSLDMLEDILKITHDKAFQSVNEIIKELARKANDAVESRALNLQTNAVEMTQGFTTPWEIPVVLQAWGYPTFADDLDVFASQLGNEIEATFM